jgi:hypothetical protein
MIRSYNNIVKGLKIQQVDNKPAGPHALIAALIAGADEVVEAGPT